MIHSIYFSSKRILILCYLIMAYTAFLFYPKWNQSHTEATLSWDTSGYYLYIPATFIYHDIKDLHFIDDILKKYQPTPELQQAFWYEKAHTYVLKYSMGQAITMLPWFGIGHFWASHSKIYPADGFSHPYQKSIGIGLFLYALLGLYFFRKLLKEFYPDKTVAVILLLIVVGSNYLNYSSIDQGLTHSNLFTLYVFIVYLTNRYYQNPDCRKALGIGLLCGLATLMRPTEIIALLIPVFWKINSRRDLLARINFLFKNQVTHSLIFILGFFCFVALQPLYWHYVSDSFFIYSYQNQGFSWLHPHIKSYLLGYNSGWLRYTPMMFLTLFGFIFSIKKGKNLIIKVLFPLLALYIVMSWDVWDYGGTSGRAMVQYYPLLAFPLADLYSSLAGKAFSKTLFWILASICIYLNIWWTYHAHRSGIKVSLVSKAYYWKTIGRWNESIADRKLLDNPFAFEGTPKKYQTIYQKDFLPGKSALGSSVPPGFLISREHPTSPEIQIFRDQNIHSWIRVYGTFTSTQKEWDIWKQPQLIIRFYNQGSVIQENIVRIFRFMGNLETKEISVDAICPTQWDTIRIQVWNAGSDKVCYLNQIRVITFDD